MRRTIAASAVSTAASPLLLDAFLAHARAVPRAEAIRGGARVLDYGTFADRVAAFARALRGAGVQRDDIVAITSERTPDTIATLLAIVGCGAAYMPIDLDFPSARIAVMLDDARPRAAIGNTALRAHLPSTVTWVDGAALDSAGVGAFDEGELAYVLFTSGSTGQPKGVAMRRASVAWLVDWHRDHPRLGKPARTLQFAPLGFDVSFQEIFTTLATGGTLVLPSEAERRDPYALLALLEREQVERLYLPYVGLQALAEAASASGETPRSLRDVVTAGEQLRITPAIRALFAALPGAVLHNHYGPTETHVVTAHELSGDPASWPELPPIGVALPHVRTRLVDAALQEVASDSEGELLLGGDCLAAGYIHRPELTAERFVDVDGARWYRSGDRARRDGAGVLDYLGRMDAQVKIDGFRIEPAEIETVLCRHPAVAEAVVVAAENAGGRHLVAHIVPREPRADERALTVLLRSHCEAMLAPYLVPRAFQTHAALPLTASGKIDRRALENGFADATLRWLDGAPLAQQLLHLWKQLLGTDTLDVDANLFDSGARSLLVVRALTELRRHGHVLSAAQIYESPTVSAQAALLEKGSASDTHSSVAERARGAAQRKAFARFGVHGGGQR